MHSIITEFDTDDAQEYAGKFGKYVKGKADTIASGVGRAAKTTGKFWSRVADKANNADWNKGEFNTGKVGKFVKGTADKAAGGLNRAAKDWGDKDSIVRKSTSKTLRRGLSTARDYHLDKTGREKIGDVMSLPKEAYKTITGQGDKGYKQLKTGIGTGLSDAVHAKRNAAADEALERGKSLRALTKSDKNVASMKAKQAMLRKGITPSERALVNSDKNVSGMKARQSMLRKGITPSERALVNSDKNVSGMKARQSMLRGGKAGDEAKRLGSRRISGTGATDEAKRLGGTKYPKDLVAAEKERNIRSARNKAIRDTARSVAPTLAGGAALGYTLRKNRRNKR